MSGGNTLRTRENRRNKYRFDNENIIPTNIMYDPRVIRGSTHKFQPKYNKQNKKKISQQPYINTKKRKTFTGKNIKNRNNNNNDRIKTPSPVKGRTHIDIQTDNYLENIYVETPTNIIGIQTDSFIDRPPTPYYIPKPNGITIGTQINDGDLFNFDNEIEPLLNVLINKIIKQSLEEYIDEFELNQYKELQFKYQQQKLIEINKCQRLEQEFKRKNEEKLRRIKQQQIYMEQQRLNKIKIDAQNFANKFIFDLENNVFNELNKKGAFYDEVRKEIKDTYMIKLIKNVIKKVNKQNIVYMILNDIINKSVNDIINNCRNSNQKINDEIKLKKDNELKYIKLCELLNEKKREFIVMIKEQRNDTDLTKIIAGFMNIDIGNDINTDNDDEKVPENIAKNREYMVSIIERINNAEEPLYKIVDVLLEGITDINDKIKAIDGFREGYNVKLKKKELCKYLKEITDENDFKECVIALMNIEAFVEVCWVMWCFCVYLFCLNVYYFA